MAIVDRVHSAEPPHRGEEGSLPADQVAVVFSDMWRKSGEAELDAVADPAQNHSLSKSH
jgi:hypothetical protein